MIASVKPRSSITRASSVYMTPIRLWSTLVIHSRHRYGKYPLTSTQRRTARMTAPTMPEATIGIGWLSGMASQPSLPNMAMPILGRSAVAGLPGLRPRTGRDLLAHDAVEQRFVSEAKRRGRDLHRLFGEFGVAVAIEHAGHLARLFDPT